MRGARCSAFHSAAPKLGDHAYLPTYLPPTSHGTSCRVTSHYWRALLKLREHAYLAPTPGQPRLLAHHVTLLAHFLSSALVITPSWLMSSASVMSSISVPSAGPSGPRSASSWLGSGLGLGIGLGLGLGLEGWD